MKAQALVILALSAIQAHAQEAPCKVTAKTESGVVCGTIRKDANGNDFASFFGIPYAKAPRGDLRFAPPQSREPFDGVFNATYPAPLCYQIPGIGVTTDAPMDEDCLILNIYVPKDSLPDQEGENKPLPVMVWVPGGSFASGSSGPDIWGPEYLMTKGIIVITMQHRLGAFGFLTLQSEEIPGNTGLLDVIFALKWVQNNIGNMGGDPSEVTLGGYSSGGITVSLISVLPAVKGLGLFKRVIALGGNVLSNTYTTAPKFSRFTSQIFLDRMGLQKQSKRVIYEELINAPAEKILEATAYVRNTTGLRITFSPVVETRREDSRLQIIPNDPEHLMNEGYGKEFTKIMGFASDECNIYKNSFENQGLISRLNAGQMPFEIVPLNLLLTSNNVTRPALQAAILNTYFNGSEITLENYLPFCHDSNFKYPVMRTAHKRVETGAAPTFIYQFAYQGENSTVKVLLGEDYPGTGHIEDITNVFRFNGALGTIQSDELAQCDDNSRMKQLMTTFFANFVKTGDPHSEWLPAGPELDFINIDEPMNPEFGPATPYLADMKQFFDNLYLVGRGD